MLYMLHVGCVVLRWSAHCSQSHTWTHDGMREGAGEVMRGERRRRKGGVSEGVSVRGRVCVVW
jgi:hypothetical protein